MMADREHSEPGGGPVTPDEAGRARDRAVARDDAGRARDRAGAPDEAGMARHRAGAPDEAGTARRGAAEDDAAKGAAGSGRATAAGGANDAGAVEMERLHPFTLLHRVIVSIPALVVVLLPVLRGPDADAWVWIALAAVYGIGVIPLILLQYLRFSYAVTPDEIIIHQGVFTYQHRNIPIERVQNIEIEQRLLPRMLGLAKVKIETAGSTSTEGVIEFVALERAQAIRTSVRAHQRALKEARRAQGEIGEARRAQGELGDVRRAQGEIDEARQAQGDAGGAPDAQGDGGGARERADERSAMQRGPAPVAESPGSGLRSEAGPDAPVETTEEPDARRGSRPSDEGPQRRAHEQDAPIEWLHTMSLGRVLLSGAFRFSMLYIVMIFTATEYLGMDPEDLVNWISDDRLDALTALLDRSPILVVVSTVVVVGLLAWITGILMNLNRFFGFRLGYEEGKLYIRHGLLTVSEGTIPLKKVQALIIRTNPLMEAFGWHRLELQTMGFDAGDRGYRVAAPFARADEIMAIAQRIRPFALPERFLPVSKLMIRRSFVRYLLVFLPAVAAAAYFWEWGAWLLIALPLLYVLAVRQYRNHGFNADDAFLFVKKGVFRKLMWVLPAERFQVFYLTQTIFQRRLGLRSLYVDTAGAGVRSHPIVNDLPETEAVSVFDETYARFQALFSRSRPQSRP